MRRVVVGLVACVVLVSGCKDSKREGLQKVVDEKKRSHDHWHEKAKSFKSPETVDDCKDQIVTLKLLAEAAQEYEQAIRRLEQHTGPDPSNSGLLEMLKSQQDIAGRIKTLEDLAEIKRIRDRMGDKD